MHFFSSNLKNIKIFECLCFVFFCSAYVGCSLLSYGFLHIPKIILHFTDHKNIFFVT